MLEVRNVSVSYGRHRALEGAALRVGKGEICVILGANGAGKSTLLKTIAGMVRGEPGGEIVMNGKRIEALKPHRIVEEGIALVPEGRGIFGDLTVAENLQLGAFAARARDGEAATLARIYQLFPRLAERKGQIARTMSGGEQQMVAIGRALMSKPEILMLDEPSLGLSPLLCQELFRALSEIAASGVGILLVEQNAKQSLKIAGRGYLIENGHVTGEASAKALMNDPAVINAYLGGATGGRALARPKIALPTSMRLPSGLEAMGRLMASLAARAGRIHQAFIRSLRRGSELPSAFVGRYDPKAGADPWEVLATEAPEPAPPHAPVVSAEARRAGADAVSLAHRARERMAAHVMTARLNASRPSAFTASPMRHDPATQAPATPQPVAPTQRKREPVTIDSAALAGRAAERSAAHLAAQRRGAQAPAASISSPPPVAEPAQVATPVAVNMELDPAALARRASDRFAAHIAAVRQKSRPGAAATPNAPMRPIPVRKKAPPEADSIMPDRPHGLIGHNSAGLDMEDEGRERSAPAAGLLIAKLAERAASIHAAHVAARRIALASALAKPVSVIDTLEPQAVRQPGATPAPGSIADLVARAAQVQAAHVAAQRKALKAFTLQSGGSSTAGAAPTNQDAPNEREKRKET